MACFDNCKCVAAGRGQQQGSILYSILNKDDHHHNHHQAHRLCACASSPERKVVVRAPETVFRAVSLVLLKTFRFVKNNVPSFRVLPAADRLRLARHSWTRLLLLGMAQERVRFETVETPRAPSLLQRILLTNQDEERVTTDHEEEEARGRGVPSAHARGIQVFLLRCSGLELSSREYAFLKVMVLFNPDVAELECGGGYMGAVQREARRALSDHAGTAHLGDDDTRLSELHGALSALRAIHAHVVAALFFRPVADGRSPVDQLIGY